MHVTIEQNASGSGKPESVFISWLIWQPRGADLAVAAAKEISKLAPYQDRDPDIVRLRRLFEQLAGRTGRPH